jgi:MoxR-like ATPase
MNALNSDGGILIVGWAGVGKTLLIKNMMIKYSSKTV